MTMELSAELKCTRSLASLDKSGTYLAVANGKTVEIRHAETMEVAHAIELSGNVVSLSWGRVLDAPCLAAGATGDMAVVMDARSGVIVADIFIGAIGLVSVSLSEAGGLAVFADAGVGATLFDVAAGKATCFVPSVLPRARWHPEGRFVALASFFGDFIFVVDSYLDGGICMRRKAKDIGLRSVAGFSWARSPCALVVWGDPLDERDAIVVLSLFGRILNKGQPIVAHSKQPNNIRHEDCGLGLRKITLSKDGTLLALGNHDGTLRVVHTRRWVQSLFVMPTRPVISTEAPPVVFKEVDRTHNSGASTLVKCEPDQVEVFRGETEGGKGIVFCAFDRSNAFVAAVAEDARNVVCVYRVAGPIVAAIVLIKPVAAMASVNHTFVVLTGGDQAYLWRPDGAGAIRVDTGIKTWRAPPQFGRIVSTANDIAMLVDPTGRCVALYVGGEQ